MKKIGSIQALRAAAAIGVVLYHMLVIEKKYAGGDHFLPGLFRIGQSGVDLFFVISGFIMVTIVSKEGRENKAVDFLIHRFSRVYPNYWFYFFITFAVFLVQPAFVNASQGGRFSFFRSFFLLPSANLPLVLIAWSLTYEIYFYFVFSFLAGLGRVKMLLSLLLWLFLLVNVNIFFHVPMSPVPALIVSPYSIEFIFGALAAMAITTVALRKIPAPALFGIVIACLASLPFLFTHFYSPNGAAGNLFRQTIIFGGVYAVLVAALVMLEQGSRLRLPPFLVRIGDISYTIYLSHLLILGAIGRIWARCFQHPGTAWDEILVFPCMLAVIVVYSAIANRLIEKPSYHLFVKWIDMLRFPRARSKEC